MKTKIAPLKPLMVPLYHSWSHILRWSKWMYGVVVRWWRKQNRRYGPWWRMANGAAALLVVFALAVPVLLHIYNTNRYNLSDAALKLVGTSEQALQKQLSYDSETATYQFNKGAVPVLDTQNPLASMQAQVGMANGQAKDKSLYALDVPIDFSKGVTYHDVNSALSFGMVPQFGALDAKVVDGHIIFPLASDMQAVYTLKNNGLKEDIVVNNPSEDTMSFSYHLNLPKTLGAKVIPDGGGAVGVYSADPSLFGDVNYSSEKDRLAVEKARETGAKTYLVFGLPSPVIKDVAGNTIGSARFELDGDTLTVVATGFGGATGPVTIDPSVVVTSTSDFQAGGNNEGMIDFSTSGQVGRGGLTGGSNGSWSGANSFTNIREHANTVAYNGYLYVIGGTDRSTSTNYTDIQYASISNGSLGTWTTATTTLPGSANTSAPIVVYNSKLYFVDATATNLTYMASINSNGSLNSFTSLGSGSTPISLFYENVVAYQGYMYFLGGTTNLGGGPWSNTVYYAAIKADGTLGGWQTTSSFTNGRALAQSVAYNGYMYIMGGGNAAYNSDVQYAPINADGTLGTWASTTSFTGARYGHIGFAYNGYMYIEGGWSGGSNYKSDVQYALINANGTLDTWRTSTAMTAARVYHSGTAYNGYLYSLGGYDGTSDYNNVWYTKIDPAGQPAGFANTSTTFTTARAGTCSVAYNGYLYVIGGTTTNDSYNNVTTVQYAALNTSTGQTGTWSTATAMPSTRSRSGCVAYNGYLYVMGGVTGTGTTNANGTIIYIAINDNGSLGATWSIGTGLESTTLSPSAFVYTSAGTTYLYVVGGYYHNQGVQYMALTSTGAATGTWNNQTAIFTGNYDFRGFAQVANYIYAFGGIASDSSSPVTTVEYITIDPTNGSLSSNGTTASMNTAVEENEGATVNGCIYSLGGNSASSTTTTVQYACPNADGSISAWYAAPSLGTAISNFSTGTASYNGYLYVAGGWNGSSVQNKIQFSYINNGGGGSVNYSSGWSTQTAWLNQSRINGAATTYNGYLYYGGGIDTSSSGAPTNTVGYGKLSSTGVPASFTLDSHAMNSTRSTFGLVAYNGYLYAIGGGTSGGQDAGDVEYAPIGANGALAAGFTGGGTFVTGIGTDSGRGGVCTVAHNGYLYVLGGGDGSNVHNDVRYSHLDADGAPGTWSGTSSFTNGREFAGCFVAGNYMYLLGGDDAPTYYNDVQSALINSDGTLGAWQYTTSFAVARTNANVSYANGFAYISGGCSASSCPTVDALPAMQYAPVYANGTLGAWQLVSNGAPGIYGTANVVAGGYMYLIGGVGSGTDGRSVQYAALNSTAHTATYSKLVDLGASANIQSITYSGTARNGQSPGLSPISFRTAGSDGAFGPILNANAITPSGANTCTAGTLGFTRYLFVTITIDDSSGYSVSGGGFADSAMTPANMTDFTVNYAPTVHPIPSVRLRSGQTLQAGYLSPLDTCITPTGGGGGGGTTPPAIASIGTDKANGSANVPSGVVSGSLVVLAASAEWHTSTAATCSAVTATGFTCATVTNNIASGWEESTFLLYKYATGSDTGSYTVTFNNVGGVAREERGVVAMRITGGPTSGNPFVDTFRTGTGSTNTATVPSFTPSANGSLLIASFWAGDVTSGSAVVPSGWTKDSTAFGDGGLLTVAHLGQTTAAATGPLSFTASGAAQPVVLIGTIRPGA